MLTVLLWIVAWTDKSISPMLRPFALIAASWVASLYYMHAAWTGLVAALGNAHNVTGLGGTHTVHYLGLINLFLPLDAALAYFGSWLSLFLVCAGIRMVKSFVPTIAS